MHVSGYSSEFGSDFKIYLDFLSIERINLKVKKLILEKKLNYITIKDLFFEFNCIVC